MSAAEPAGERARIDAALEQVRRARATTPPEPLPRIAGYELARELRRGGQGVVYRGRQLTTGQEVAVKLLREGAASERARELFEREVAVLARLRHPSLVAIHDCGAHEGRLYYAMEYVAGRDLDEELAAAPRALRATVELLAEVCEAVAAAHARGVLHRDLKPGNVRIDEDGRVRLLDFGLARWLGEDAVGLESAEGFVGSAPWASPEQVEGLPLDARSDVYALGVIAYQALTGAFPYPVDGALVRVFESIRGVAPRPPRELRPEIDRDLATILLTALAKTPERRYQSAHELARDLRNWLERRPIDARRDSTLYVIGKVLRRHRVASVTVAGVLALIAVASVLVVESRSRWRELARQLDARLHAERVGAIAEAWRRGDGRALEAQLAAVPAEGRDWSVAYFAERLGRRRWSFAGGDERPLAADWSPDGARIALGSWQGSVWMLDATTGTPAWTREGLLLEVRALAFDPSGERVLVLESRALHALDAATGALVRTIEWPEGGLERLSTSPRGTLVGGNGGNVALLDGEGTLVRALRLTHPEVEPGKATTRVSGVQLVALHAPTLRIATAGRDRLRVWDAETGELRHETPLGAAERDAGLAALAFSPDGARVAVGIHPAGASPGVVLVIDAASGRRLAALENLDTSPVVLLPGAASCWIGTREGVLGERALPGGQLLAQLPGFGAATRQVLPAPGGARMALLTDALALWELDPPARPNSGSGPRAVARLTDGRWWRARAGEDERVELASDADAPLDVRLSQPAPAAIALDAQRVLAVWGGGAAELVDLERDASARWELGLNLRRAALAGEAVVAAAADGSLVRLEPRDGTSRALARGPLAPSALAVRRDALAVAGEGRVELRELDGGELRGQLELDTRETLVSLTFLDAPERLIAATADGRLLLLDLAQERVVCDLSLGDERADALAFDAERGELAALTLDGRLVLRRALR